MLENNAKIPGFLGASIIMGVLAGFLFAITAQYKVKQTLKLSIHIAAVMFILPMADTRHIFFTVCSGQNFCFSGASINGHVVYKEKGQVGEKIKRYSLLTSLYQRG